jgi:hypothetical protein
MAQWATGHNASSRNVDKTANEATSRDARTGTLVVVTQSHHSLLEKKFFKFLFQ